MAESKRARRGRGEGGVTFDEKKGLWVGSVSLGYKADGKRKRKKVYGKTKKEALQKLADVRAQAGSGQLPDAGNLTVGQLLNRWVEAAGDRWGANTAEGTARVVKYHLLPRVGAVKLAKLTALHVESLYAELRPLGGMVPRSAADALSTALNYAVRLKLVPGNPCKLVAKPRRPKPPMVVLDRDHLPVFLAAAAELSAGDLLALALGTGLRTGELLALEWDCVDLDRGIVHVRRAVASTNTAVTIKEPKTKSGLRSVVVDGFALGALKARYAKSKKAGHLAAPVFCTSAGTRLIGRHIRRTLYAVVRRANKATPSGGKPIPPGFRMHGLRHTHASLLLSDGHSLRAVSQRLGHSNPAMTLSVYSHCLPADDSKLAAGIAHIAGGAEWPPNGPPETKTADISRDNEVINHCK